MKSILIFDSGVGGLSVFKEINKLMPKQHIIYAFDNEAFPYGELADDVLISRVCAIVGAICEKHSIELVVIACNTASTLVLPPLRAMLNMPVVGVVPAIKPAALMSQRKKIGLLATPATIKRSYTLKLIQEFAADCEVELLGSTELVHMAEAKLRGDELNMKQLELILKPLIGEVDCVVLGCTHFPLLKKEIELVLGKQCKVIDSGSAIANRVSSLLEDSPEIESLSALHQAMSSIKAKEEIRLNRSLAELGFEQITRCPAF